MISHLPTDQVISAKGFSIPSYVRSTSNLDQKTVDAFGDEWGNFSKFSEDEIKKVGHDYFKIIPNDVWRNIKSALDVGCGSGRWTQYVAKHVERVYSVDPSSAVFVAARNCQGLPNVTVLHASVAELPFEPGQFDLVFSLGVLHHVPDTSAAIKDCALQIKRGGWFLVYLYYSLDNRGPIFKALFHATNFLRQGICRLPKALKNFVCDIIAYLIYLPMAILAAFIEKILGPRAAGKIPLNYYRKTSFFVMRNDARDRFWTPLEQRFSKQKINEMLKKSGFTNIRFSDEQPYWVALAQKK